MDDKAMDRLIDQVLDRYQACDAEGVNKLYSRLKTDDEREAFDVRLRARVELMQEEAARIKEAKQEMLRLLGMTEEEFAAKMREEDKGKIGFPKEFIESHNKRRREFQESFRLDGEDDTPAS
jgi:hypothetical protein